MTLLIKPWQYIETNPNTNERAYGRNRLQSYGSREIFRLRELQWLRDAIWDVRRSMQLHPGEFIAQRVEIYEELGIELPQSSWFIECLEAVRRLFVGPFRKRRGFVIYGESPMLYLSRKGVMTPRVIYEEVAHAILRELPVESSDRSLRDHDLERYINALLTQLPGFPQRTVHWPIECHLDIYRGFLNGSQAYAHSSEADRDFVRNQVHRLESILQCRRITPTARRHCPCDRILA